MNFYKPFKVSFFGHRDFSEHLKLEAVLEELLKSILSKHEFVEFYIGRQGEFDQFVSSTIKKVRRDYYECNSELVLILPYSTAEFKDNEDNFKKYYDNIIIYAPQKCTHYKALITERNHYMILNSDLVIFYVKSDHGGAYNAMKFAKNNNIHMINLYE